MAVELSYICNRCAREMNQSIFRGGGMTLIQTNEELHLCPTCRRELLRWLHTAEPKTESPG